MLLSNLYQLLGTRAKGGGSVTPTPADFFHDTITVADGSANAFVYQPYDIDNPPDGGWPVVIYFGGDGTDNSATTAVTGQAMSTSDDLTYTHSPSMSGRRILSRSVVINVNGSPVGYGQFGGSITGTGISSGTMGSLDSGSPSVSVTFSSSQAGNTITYDFIHSSMLIEGAPRFINFGDTINNRGVMIAIQNVNDNSDFNQDYFDETVAYAWNNFTINPKRISAWGLSRGGRNIIDQMQEGANTSVLKARYNFWINRSTGALTTTDPENETTHATGGLASVVCATASYGGTFTAANYTDIGIAIVHGASDGTLTNTTYSLASSLEANNEPPYILNLWGVSHSSTAWETNCYNRQYRTDTSGTAPWDYVDFTFKYSRDALECATLFVEQAEQRRYNTEKDIIDYRHALRKVSALSASAEKTALEGRLSTLKSSIDGAGTRWVLNPHNFGNNEASPYNNLGTATTGTLYSSLLDFEGNTTGLDFEYGTASGGSNGGITSNRRSWTGGFSKIANNAGVLISNTTGTFEFTDVPSGTYTVRFYHNEGSTNYTNEAELSITLNSQTKTQYSAINSLLGFIEFTSVPHTALSSFTIVRGADRSTYLTIMELYLHP